MKTLHYGITVDSETPITGVFLTNKPEWFIKELNKGIDIDFEEHCKTCSAEYHDDCYESNDETTYIVGDWIKNKEGKYEPDPAGEYSAISSGTYSQVVRSKFVSRTTLCSPCFPGQGDLDTIGEFLTYTLPEDVWGQQSHLDIILLNQGHRKLTEPEFHRMLNVYASGPLKYKEEIDEKLFKLGLVEFHDRCGDDRGSTDIGLPSSEFFDPNGRVKKEWYDPGEKITTLCPYCKKEILFLAVSQQVEGEIMLPDYQGKHEIVWKMPFEQKEPIIYSCPHCMATYQNEELVIIMKMEL